MAAWRKPLGLLTTLIAASACGGQATKSSASGATNENGGGRATEGSAGDANASTGGVGETPADLPCSLSCELAEEAGSPICDCARSYPECTTDADCELASNAGACCNQPLRAYPASLIEAEPCLMQTGDYAAHCPRPDCSEVTCPVTYLSRVLYAACEDGQCVWKEDCPEPLVDEHNVCVPPCTSDDDCVMAGRVGGCCGGDPCTSAMNRVRVEQDECIVPMGEPVPTQCLPSPGDCPEPNVCSSVGCIQLSERAACSESGLCIGSE